VAKKKHTKARKKTQKKNAAPGRVRAAAGAMAAGLEPAEAAALANDAATPASDEAGNEDKSAGGRGWFSKQEMAAIFGISEQHFDRSFRSLVPADAQKLVGRRWYFRARGVAAVDAEFAEQEIVIPTGPFAGRRFRCDRQPFAGCGSTRSTRGLAAGGDRAPAGRQDALLRDPPLYHLFEVGETVICGVPTWTWSRTSGRRTCSRRSRPRRYRDLLPRRGARAAAAAASPAASVPNGATLRFMTGGGGDKGRAGFTSRVWWSSPRPTGWTRRRRQPRGGQDHPARGPHAAFGDRARIYMECTVSDEAGRTWQEYTKGHATAGSPCGARTAGRT
jgi:hypothetical protein